MNLSPLVPEILGVLFLAGMILAEILKPKKTSLNLTVPALLCAFLLTAGAFFTHATGTAFNNFFIQDGLSLFFKTFFSAVFFILIAMSAVFSGLPAERRNEFYLILWSCLLGAFFLVSANDFLVFFIGLEIVTLAFYIMAAFLKNNSSSIEAGLKYLILGSLASAFIIYGISLIYVTAGTTSFEAVKDTLSAQAPSKIALIGILFIISGLGFKIAASPFNLWAPDVYEGAPAPVAAGLAVASKAAGIAILIRLLFAVFPAFDSQRALLFSVLAAMTILYGNLGAIAQTNIKRLLGYSSISNAGYLMIGLAAGQAFGTQAVLYYLIPYAFANLTVFYVITLASNHLQSDQIEAYQGLAKRSPFLAGALFTALLSLAGLPPLAGFFGKFYILLAAVHSGLFWLAAVGALTVIISLYYYLSIVRVMYFEEPDDTALPAVPVLSRIVIGFLLAGILLAGFWQAPFFAAAEQAVKSLF